MPGAFPVIVRPRPDTRLDSRLVLRVYMWTAFVTGIAVVGTGFRGIPGLPWERSSLVWIGGALLIVASSAASGLSLIDDPADRRRALYSFGGGHLLLGLVAWSQWALLWDERGVPLLPVMLPIVAGIALLVSALVMTWTAMEETSSGSGPRKRASYDEHIRQIARREERARLARDLHDAVKQQLFVIQTAAATAQARLTTDAEGARTAVDHVRTAARDATTELEALLEELQAVPTENTGLVAALRKQCDALALRTGTHVTFDTPALPPHKAMAMGAHEAIYRVAQEALANVARHARASRVTVALTTEGRRLELRVTDNGGGFDRSSVNTGMGTANMQARAAELNGRLEIVSSPSGTDVRLSLPLRSPAMTVLWVYTSLAAFAGFYLAVYHWVRGVPPTTGEAILLTVASIVFAAYVITTFGRMRRQELR
jgi:signal transduction histidine kinase